MKRFYFPLLLKLLFIKPKRQLIEMVFHIETPGSLKTMDIS